MQHDKCGYLETKMNISFGGLYPTYSSLTCSCGPHVRLTPHVKEENIFLGLGKESSPKLILDEMPYIECIERGIVQKTNSAQWFGPNQPCRLISRLTTRLRSIVYWRLNFNVFFIFYLLMFIYYLFIGPDFYFLSF